MIRKSGYRFSLGTNAKRLPGDHAQKKIERDDDSKKRHPALARAAGATDPDTDRATNLHAGLSAVYFDKSRTKRSARIAGGSTFQREQLARTCGLVRLPMAGLLGQRDRGRQQRHGNDRKEGVSHPAFLSRVTCFCYRTNLTPTDFPRRQTTSQGRPVLASRVNANRNFAGNMLGSSMVILAPVEDMFCTTHGRAAKPPSRVIQPGWRSDLRTCRFFLVARAISVVLRP